MKAVHFLYHELRQDPTNYSYVMPQAEFEEHCALFASELSAPGRELIPAITFDDGHRSDYTIALPLLQRFGLPAHFFITAGWTGERAGYMNWDELKTLHSSGHTIGAHGWSHKLLTHCNITELNHELSGSRKLLEDRLGAPVTSMSLPGGRANQRVLEACWEAGYSQVFTSVPRAEPLPPQPRTTLGRLNLVSGTGTLWLERVLRPETGELHRLQRKERLKSAARQILGDQVYAKLWALVNRQEEQPEMQAR